MDKKISAFSFFTMTSAMVMTVYVYPTFATAGASLIFFILLSGLVWFLPTALTSAEMASINNWENDGIFSWVSNTLGEKWAFMSVFFQWFQITIGFVPMLFFIAGMLSVALKIPEINTNPAIKLAVILAVFWGVTLLQFLGTKMTSIISKIGFFFGVLIPIVLLIGFTGVYLANGHTNNLVFKISDVVPKMDSINSLVVFVSFILAYLGIEASAIQINNIKGGKKNYPKIIIAFCIFSIIINMLAGLSIAVAVPKADINLSTGLMQAFENLINALFNGNNQILISTLAIIIMFSTIAKISTWVVSPSEGLYLASEKGILPKFFLKENKNKIPTNIIFIQSIIVTIWCILLTFVSKNGNLAFTISISLTVLIYLMAYIIMYVAYFKLVLKQSSLERTYQIKGGKAMKLFVATVGFITTILAFIISFFPPSGFTKSEQNIYIIVLIVSFILTLFIPLIIYKMKNKENKNNE